MQSPRSRKLTLVAALLVVAALAGATDLATPAVAQGDPPAPVAELSENIVNDIYKFGTDRKWTVIGLEKAFIFTPPMWSELYKGAYVQLHRGVGTPATVDVFLVRQGAVAEDVLVADDGVLKGHGEAARYLGYENGYHWFVAASDAKAGETAGGQVIKYFKLKRPQARAGRPSVSPKPKGPITSGTGGTGTGPKPAVKKLSDEELVLRKSAVDGAKTALGGYEKVAPAAPREEIAAAHAAIVGAKEALGKAPRWINDKGETVDPEMDLVMVKLEAAATVLDTRIMALETKSELEKRIAEERKAAEEARKAAEEFKAKAEETAARLEAERARAEESKKTAEEALAKAAEEGRRLTEVREQAEKAAREAEDAKAKAMAEELARKAAEAEARKAAEVARLEAEARKAAEDAARAATEEAATKVAAEHEARKVAEAEVARLAAESEQAKRAAEEAAKKATELEAAAKKQAEAAKAAEEQARKAAEEEAAKKAAEAEAAKKAAEEEARKAAEAEAARKAAEEEARKAVEAERLAAAEEAKRRTEEAAAKAAADEAARAAAEEAAARRGALVKHANDSLEKAKAAQAAGVVADIEAAGVELGKAREEVASLGEDDETKGLIAAIDQAAKANETALAEAKKKAEAAAAGSGGSGAGGTGGTGGAERGATAMEKLQKVGETEGWTFVGLEEDESGTMTPAGWAGGPAGCVAMSFEVPKDGDKLLVKVWLTKATEMTPSELATLEKSGAARYLGAGHGLHWFLKAERPSAEPPIIAKLTEALGIAK